MKIEVPEVTGIPKVHVCAHSSLLATGIQNKRAFLAGEVVLLGAGPGDPELLTIKALRLLQEADCVVYDRLVSAEIMAMIPDSVEKIYVGKKCDEHTLTQLGINQLLIDKARSGKKVARLKGGDPFIFGRGGEEVQDLLKAGVACRVVPGITSASACTTYAGIPLTHRDFVHGCTFITGHLQEGNTINLPWEALARDDHTLVVYMGIKTARILSDALIQHGLSSDTPVGLIHQGTTDMHQTFRTCLGELSAYIQAHNIKPPTLIVIGKVVNALQEDTMLMDSFPEQASSDPGRGKETDIGWEQRQAI